MSRSLIRRSIPLLILMLPAALPALSPFYGPHDLVAGSGRPGTQDGPFETASFHHPGGLALDPKDRILYVADLGNQTIRAIHLAEKDRVSTPWNGASQDPAHPAIKLSKPEAMVFVPDLGLVIADNDLAQLLLGDPAKPGVMLLAGAGSAGFQDGPADKAQVGEIFDMAFDPSRRWVYFTQPLYGTLRALDLTTHTVRTLIAKNTLIPHPACLAMGKDGLYLSDLNNGTLYLFTPPPPGKEQPALQTVTTAGHIVGLVEDQGDLYAALADSEEPILQVLPSTRHVHSLTLGGKVLKDPANLPGPWPLNPRGRIPLVADPRDHHRFFFTQSNLNRVFTFRDLLYDELRTNESSNGNGVIDFDYPGQKPPGVFRILLVGDSHAYHDYDPQGDKNDRMFLVAKRLESDLNLEASLGDQSCRFEVLTQAQVSWFPLPVWPYHKVPKTAEKYDIDQVVVLWTKKLDMEQYLLGPVNADGVPPDTADPEFLLKPWGDRLLASPFRDLYQLAQKKGWVDPKNGHFLRETIQMAQDPEARSALAQGFILPYRKLREKMESRHRTWEKTPRMVLCVLPHPGVYQDGEDPELWDEIEKDFGGQVLDLTPYFNAYRTTYSPYSEASKEDHLDRQGHDLLARILRHVFIQRGWVPWEAPPAH